MADVASSLGSEWRAWLAENVVRGVASERLVDTLVSAGVPLARACAEIEATRAHPAVAAGLRRMAPHEDVLCLLDTRVALHRHSGRHQRLERRTDVSVHELMARYYLAHEPVLLAGFMRDWPLMANWRPEALSRRHGHVEVEVMAGREARADHDVEPDACRSVMRLGEFLRRLEEGGPTNDLYLTARNFALEREELRGLLDDVRYPPGLLRESARAGAVKLWVGPSGTRTELHHDLGTVLFGQVFGRKRFRLIPSFHTHHVYSHLEVWSQVDADRPDLTRFPSYREADVLEVVVEPGDMLLIPAGWWHWVHALDVSVSVTFQEFDVPDGNTWWKLG
ncbi:MULTISPECIES: cupin-like domain-containing protein [Myxococcus]|uniref:Cupin-like domain-containing protein n=1 Tax=Myxococcus llanfairpwllgwyngyllgogerychwyrndrobwllllantysiliogogogochensis TaxID=2590453 RepID=A0A540WQW5_9BACT|nr:MULTISPECIES: cupin-like domain-containing protein [Myxococcus]NTX08385.1 cupin-like domain-containing protein [Myxococcus sp. CA040A]TQF11400.1 cupin-like domain-containing protein [Myxococcus llanfairpwllgwyngyllgogerychwyrndrobwllllantysiliogogogochensis]